MAHAMVTKLIGDKLFLAPLPEQFSGKVLDAGCGTGIWSICMGDLFPAADIRGVDLSPIQPSWVSGPGKSPPYTRCVGKADR